MKEKFSIFFKDNMIKYSIFISLILFLLNLIFVMLLYSKFPPYVPFFNSMPWGEERLVSSYAMPILSGLFLFTILLNGVIGIFLYENYPLIARLLSIASFLFVFLGFIASLQILFLVF